MNQTSVPYMTSFPGGARGKIRKGRHWTFVTDEELTEFIATAVNTGTSAISDAVAGGGLLLSGAATTDDSGQNIQLDATPIKLAANESVRMMGRVTLSDATESDLWFGLAVVDTSIIAGISDFVGFRKVDGSAALECVYIRDSGTAETLAAVTVAANTELTLAFESYVDDSGGGRTAFFVNGKSIGEIVHTTNHLGENFNTPSIAFQSGTATGTITCTVHELGLDWDQ